MFSTFHLVLFFGLRSGNFLQKNVFSQEITSDKLYQNTKFCDYINGNVILYRNTLQFYAEIVLSLLLAVAKMTYLDKIENKIVPLF